MSDMTMEETKRPGLFAIGMLRGVLFLIVGTLVGMGIVTGVRAVMGLPAWNPNTAWTLNAIFSTAAFMYNVNALND